MKMLTKDKTIALYREVYAEFRSLVLRSDDEPEKMSNLLSFYMYVSDEIEKLDALTSFYKKVPLYTTLQLIALFAVENDYTALGLFDDRRCKDISIEEFEHWLDQ